MKPFRVSERLREREERGPPNCRRRKIRCESPTSLPFSLSQEYNHRVKRRSISQHPAQKWQKNLINGSPSLVVSPSLAKLMGHPVLLHLQSSPPDIMAEQQRRRLWSEQFLASCTSLISLIHLRLSLPHSLRGAPQVSLERYRSQSRCRLKE